MSTSKRFIAYGIAFASALVLCLACTPGAETVVADMASFDKELAGCKTFRVTFNSQGGWGYVIRCPAMDSTTTSYRVGKSTQAATVLSDPPEADKQKQIDEIMKQLDALSVAVGKLK